MLFVLLSSRMSYLLRFSPAFADKEESLLSTCLQIKQVVHEQRQGLQSVNDSKQISEIKWFLQLGKMTRFDLLLNAFRFCADY